MATLYAGIDVQVRRPCPIAVIDDRGHTVAAQWLVGQTDEDIAEAAVQFIARQSAARIVVGIDAPRQALITPRKHYWEGSRGSWRNAKWTDVGHGRHCEIVIAAHKLASPQWTPLQANAPAWMRRGFALFRALGSKTPTYEVFPSASYRQLRDSSCRIEIDVGQLAAGPKDMLDAYLGAVTVREFVAGRGAEVGGQDGLGTIILPRPLERPVERVLVWPAA